MTPYLILNLVLICYLLWDNYRLHRENLKLEALNEAWRRRVVK